MNRKIKSAIISLVLLLLPLQLFALRSYDEYLEILEYGISSTRLLVIDEIESSGDASLHPLLVELISFEDNNEIIEKALYAITRLKVDGAGPHLEKFLSDEWEPQITSAALSAIGSISYTPLLSNVIACLENEDNRIIESAVYAIGSMEADEALPDLIELFNDRNTNEVIKQAIITTCGKLDNPEAVPFLIETFGRSGIPESVRMYCLTSLGDQGSRDGMPVLIQAMDSNNHFFVLRAVEALGRMPFHEAVQPLTDALRRDHNEIRMQAVKSIENLIDNLGQSQLAEVFRPLRYISRNDPERAVRNEAVIALCKLGTQEAISFIQEAVQDETQELRFLILINANLLDISVSIPMLKREYQSHADNSTRLIILQTLKKIEQPAAAETMIEFANQIDLSTRENFNLFSVIIDTLSKRDEYSIVIPFFQSQSRHENIYVRAIIAHYFANIRQDRTVSILRNWYADEENLSVKSNILKSLARSGSEGLDFVKSLVMIETDPALIREISIALSEQGLSYHQIRQDMESGTTSQQNNSQTSNGISTSSYTNQQSTENQSIQNSIASDQQDQSANSVPQTDDSSLDIDELIMREYPDLENISQETGVMFEVQEYDDSFSSLIER